MSLIDAKYQRWLQETEELISLAEKSTLSIDNLLESNSKIKKKYIALAVLVYAFISSMFVTLTTSTLRFSFNIDSIIILSGTLFFSAMALWAVFLVQDSKKIKRDLQVELAIHSRLMSMLDDQIFSCPPYVEVSPVVIATFEMRVRRLDRKY